MIMIGDAGGSWPATPCHVHVYLEDVDAAYAEAVEVGGISVRNPARRDGELDRRGGVT